MDITAFAKPIFRIDVPAAGVISCRTCAVITYRRLKCGTFTAEDITDIIIGDLPPFLHSTLTIFIQKYIAELDKYRKDNCDILQVPDDGSEPEKKCRLGVSTFYDHCVKDYSGFNFAEINELNIIDYGKCTNSNSIGIEICCMNSTGKMQNANDKSYSFTDAAVANAEWLVKKLMAEYNIPAEHVVRHYDVTGKPCPGIIGWNADSGSEAKWTAFKQAVSGGAVSAAPKYYVQVGAFSDKANAESFLKTTQKKYPDAFIKRFEGSGLYFVQVGAFGSKANAEKYLAEVKKIYPDAFIKVM